MIVDIIKCEDKTADWKVCGILNDAKTAIENVSVNRTNKEGKVFPGFDNIKAGATVECNLWQNPAGKWYMFAPDIKAAPKGSGMTGVKAAQERKGEMIQNALDTKGKGILVASAFRDATLICIEIMRKDPESEPFDTPAIFALHDKIVKWYMHSWADAEKSLDIPF